MLVLAMLCPHKNSLRHFNSSSGFSKTSYVFLFQRPEMTLPARLIWEVHSNGHSIIKTCFHDEHAVREERWLSKCLLQVHHRETSVKQQEPPMCCLSYQLISQQAVRAVLLKVVVMNKRCHILTPSHSLGGIPCFIPTSVSRFTPYL